VSEQLDFSTLAVNTPSWASACFYCVPDDFGAYDEAHHYRQHLALTCAVCGEVSPNRLLFEMDHGINLGASWRIDKLLCSSLSLRLNHLTYDLRQRETPQARDLAALDLGWRLDPYGEHLAPEGWPAAPTFDEAYGPGWRQTLERIA